MAVFINILRFSTFSVSLKFFLTLINLLLLLHLLLFLTLYPHKSYNDLLHNCNTNPDQDDQVEVAVSQELGQFHVHWHSLHYQLFL